MRRQASLSLRVAVVFLVLVLGLPLFNLCLPQVANANLMGFTVSWLFLGVLFFPITWVLSAYFIKQSDKIEEECADWREVLGVEAGEPIVDDPASDVHPAFIESDKEEPHA
jgi:uncharacterized membrane protein (DUF485 family)